MKLMLWKLHHLNRTRPAVCLLTHFIYTAEFGFHCIYLV